MRLTAPRTVLSVVLALSGSAGADQIIAQPTGLAGADNVIGFGNGLFPNHTVITTQFPPVTFNGARYFTTGSLGHFVGGFLHLDSMQSPDFLSIKFNGLVRDVSLAFQQVNPLTPTIFRALRGGVVVDSFAYTWSPPLVDDFFGFTDLEFDELEIQFSEAYFLDQLAFNDFISPGTAYCFGDGSGANCPCSAFGAAGAGCANTAGPGATLTGGGLASIALDSFQLQVIGAPANIPGLVLRGNSQVALPAGDGILCTTGGSQRSQVQVTVGDTTTFLDFNGQGFSTVSPVGVPTNFQFWYRDPGSACSGAGFNFSNGWSVTFQP